jgi:hypothetical protein
MFGKASFLSPPDANPSHIKWLNHLPMPNIYLTVFLHFLPSVGSGSENNSTYTNVTIPFCEAVNFGKAELLLYRYILVFVQVRER